MQQPRWTWSTLAIVSATVALVFGPVFIPREISRWYLAGAANAYRLGDRTLGEHYLNRAIDWDSSIVSDGDFWIAQMGTTNSDDKLDLLAKAIQIDPHSAPMALQVAQLFADEFDFQRAIRALKLAYPDGQPTDANGLNFLAYLRAQAGVDLEQALKDIDRAIAMAGDDPGMLDTKAWVLHGLRRDREALYILNEAIEKLEKKSKKTKAEPSGDKESQQADKSPPAASATEEAGPSEEASQLEKPLSETEQLRKRIQVAKARLGPELWNIAVLRFHRLRIYEALDIPAETKRDRQWLLEHGVPIVDELF